MSAIFTAGPLFSGQEGFGLFSRAHFAWIAVCAVLITVLVRYYMHLPADTAWSPSTRQAKDTCHHAYLRTGTAWTSPRRRMLIVVAVVPLALLTSEIVLMIAADVFQPAYWPLHFCSFAEYFCLWHALTPHRVNRELAFFFGLSGGTMAILFANWSYCPWWAWVTICDFLEHALICAYALMIEVDPHNASRPQDILFSIAFAAAYTALFRWLNPLLGTSFGFVNGASPGSPLETWEKAFGDPGYLVVYALVSLAVLIALHACLELRRRRTLPN